MQTPSGSPSQCAPWVLLLGPGARLARLSAHLRPSTAGGEDEGPESVETLEDLGQLFCDFPQYGRIVLDSDALLLEEVGLVAAFLAHRPGWRLDLVGSDPGAGAPRRLLASRRARWLPWPVDLEQLEELVRFESGPGVPEPAGATPTAQAPGTRADPSGARLAPELRAEIERILGASTPEAAPPAPAPQPRRDPTPPVATGPATAAPRAATAAHPPYFRAQVADLADRAQRLELAVNRARHCAEEAEAAQPELLREMERLLSETWGLLEFTRTLGYLASPPARGDQRIELAEMAEEHLASVGREPGAPRYLFRTDGPLWVRADKLLMAKVLDALVFLAQACAGPEGTVHVEGRSRDGGESASVELSIRFPAGPLEDVGLERGLEPYALRRALPELGPNALAAARGIVAGQGGSLALEPAGQGRARWVLRLPGLDAATF